MIQKFRQNPRQAFVLLAVLLAALAFLVTDSPKGDRALVEKAIEEMAAAAEDKSLGAFKKYLSDDLEVGTGDNKETALNRLRGLFLTHPRIGITIVSIDFQDNSAPDEQTVVVSTLMSETVLPRDRATFLITFRKEGALWRAWRISVDGAADF